VPVIDILSDTRYSVCSQDCKQRISILTTTLRKLFSFCFQFHVCLHDYTTTAVEVTFSGISQVAQVVEVSLVDFSLRFRIRLRSPSGHLPVPGSGRRSLRATPYKQPSHRLFETYRYIEKDYLNIKC
jgi:hypothetical protein